MHDKSSYWKADMTVFERGGLFKDNPVEDRKSSCSYGQRAVLQSGGKTCQKNLLIVFRMKHKDAAVCVLPFSSANECDPMQSSQFRELQINTSQ